MGKSQSTRVLSSALVASFAVHTGLALLAIEIGVGTEGGSPARSDAGPPMMLAWADESPVPEEPPPPVAKPEEEQPPPQPEPEPEPEELERFRLGIEKSDLDTENWIGFAEPTPHEAQRADVVQPALEPDAGPPASQGQPAVMPVAPASTPGNEGSNGPDAPPAPPLPNQMPAPAVPATQPTDASNPQDSAEQPPQDAGGHERVDTPAEPNEGTPQPDVDDPESPLMIEGEGTTEQLAAELQDGFVGPPFEASDAETKAEESAIAEAVPPPAVPPGEPGKPSEPPTVASAPGATSDGGSPGEKSELEADPTSLTDPITVRLGRPAAAEGLEIITKRPDYSLVARVTSYPTKNPRLKVTFNREGRVSNAFFLDPTGLSDIDAPTLHAVYRWTARGEALLKLPANDPKAGLSITVTILLR